MAMALRRAAIYAAYVVDCAEEAQLIEDRHLAAIAYSQAASSLCLKQGVYIIQPATY